MAFKNKKNQRTRISGQEDGAAAIEFAIIAPILFLLMMGIMEFGLIIFANNVVENATVFGARYGITGSNYSGEARVASAGDRIDVIKGEIRRASGGLLSEDLVTVTCQPLGEVFGDIPQSQVDDQGAVGFGDDPSSDNCESVSANADNNLGIGNEAVIYNVAYRWPIFTPFIGKFFNEQGDVQIESTLIVKNEGF